MKATISIFRQYLLSGFRDKFSVFWTFLFPLVLLSVITLIFGNITENAGINLTISLINEDSQFQDGPTNFANIIEEVLIEQSNQEQSWMSLIEPENKQLSTEIEALKNRERHAVILIPEGFSLGVLSNLTFNRQLVSSETEKPQITIYRREYDQASGIAASILKEIVNGVMDNISFYSGRVQPESLASINTRYLEIEGESFHFASYLLPGIILMSIMMTGISTVVEVLLLQRDRKILRRYFTTPVTTIQYFVGISLYVIFLSIIQVILTSSFGYFVFGTRIKILSISSLFYLGFALSVLFSIGFLIASIAKNANSGAAVMNVILYPMMFLGGLFFPLEHLPLFLQVFVRINPMTYLINGLRDTLGLYPSFTAPTLNILVPLAWLLFSIIYSIKKFRWEAN